MVQLKRIQMLIKIDGLLQKAQKKLTWPEHRCFSGWSSAGALWQRPGLGSSCPIPEQGNSWWLQRAPSLHRLSRWKPHPLHCYSDKPLEQVHLKYVPHAKTPFNRPASDTVKQKTLFKEFMLLMLTFSSIYPSIHFHPLIWGRLTGAAA